MRINTSHNTKIEKQWLFIYLSTLNQLTTVESKCSSSITASQTPYALCVTYVSPEKRYMEEISLLNKDVWRKAWLNSIFELTTYNLQARTWLDSNNTNLHYTFEEFMCCYFDDLLNNIPYEEYIKMGWVSEKEYQTLREWHSRLDNYQPLETMTLTRLLS